MAITKKQQQKKRKNERKTSATATGFAIATKGIKCHIENNARIRATNYTSLLSYFTLPLHTHRIISDKRLFISRWTHIHIYLFSIDIYIDLIFSFDFIELLRLCCTIILSLSFILYPLMVFHVPPESRQHKCTNF